MSEAHVLPESPALEALHRRLAEHSLGAHWQPRERLPKLRPWVWPWQAVYSCLLESGEVVEIGAADEAARRRTVQLVNPGITHLKSTTRTIQMSVQLVKPGEQAECHRHTAAALRFVVEGDGTAYTNVEGEEMLMEPGDLVLTPSWDWHDHFNPGNSNVVWLDVHDTHLANYFDAFFLENYGDGPAQPLLKPDGYCRENLGVVRPRIAGVNNRAMPYTYKWRDTLEALTAQTGAGRIDPHDGVLLEYAHPITGGPTMPTIGCWVQLIPPGMTTRLQRHTGSTIYHVIQGEGVTSLGENQTVREDLGWGAKDCFFVPSWQWYQMTNASSSEPAIIFSVTDRPVLEALGLYREERV